MGASINQSLVCSFVKKLLLQSGYMIYQLDYEKVLYDLKEKGTVKDYKPYLNDIKNYAYDFMLVANKRPYFVQIKFCKKPEFKNEKGYNQGEILFVTPKEPVFQIANTKEFLENGKTIPLDKFLELDGNLLKKYKGIIKRRFPLA
ncbi:MAG: hypothetical protein L6408_02720 [Nanoarchaeota archaeon]|nr:hypothetical protein [Nanoarchaeota archaeon]